jgi:hypothetical protein
MKAEFSITNLVKLARSGQVEAGRTLAYVLTGLISGALPDAGIGHHKCIIRGNYAMLSWADMEGEEAFRVYLAEDGDIGFIRYWDNGGAISSRIFPSISRMVLIFREAARVARLAPGTKPKFRIWPLNARQMK